MFGWFYLSQMEWYIGFEFLRWASIFVLVSRTKESITQKIMETIRRAYVLILIPGIFLVWRILLFKPERSATDIGLQMGQILQSPRATGLQWLSTLVTDSLDVVFFAWGQPLSLLLPWIHRPGLFFLGMLLSVFAALAVLVVLQQIEDPIAEGDESWKREALVLGGSSVFAGLFPIVLVNRFVDFSFYSRYTLVSSTGAIIFLVSLIFLLKQSSFQKMIIFLLVVVASLTHFANSQKAVQVTQATREFWWQIRSIKLC